MKNLLFLALFISTACQTSAQNTIKRTQQRTTTTVKTTPTPMSPENFRAEMLRQVNDLRKTGCNCGNTWYKPVPPLTWNNQLETAAIRHAKDMSRNNHFDHTGTDGSEFDGRVAATGYKWAHVGENIAFGYRDITDVIKGWIKSVSHCTMMMSPNVTEIGAAQSGLYWVQDFARPYK